jgi:hypothetical protein
MKKIFILILIFFFISCNNEKTIDKITISGIINDINNNSIDSVKITLEESTCFMCMGPLPIETKYSDESGSFGFIFTPKKNKLYHINFEKKGYIKKTYYVNLNQEYQNCNITIESDSIK